MPSRVYIIAFDKERVHNAVEIDIFGLCIHGHQFSQFAPPPPRKIIQARMASLPSAMCFVSSGSHGSQVSRFASRVGVLACRVDLL